MQKKGDIPIKEAREHLFTSKNESEDIVDSWHSLELKVILFNREDEFKKINCDDEGFEYVSGTMFEDRTDDSEKEYDPYIESNIFV